MQNYIFKSVKNDKLIKLANKQVLKDLYRSYVT